MGYAATTLSDYVVSDEYSDCLQKLARRVAGYTSPDERRYTHVVSIVRFVSDDPEKSIWVSPLGIAPCDPYHPDRGNAGKHITEFEHLSAEDADGVMQEFIKSEREHFCDDCGYDDRYDEEHEYCDKAV